jgi:NitT/TauT family transport system substrate-binding protein
MTVTRPLRLAAALAALAVLASTAGTRAADQPTVRVGTLPVDTSAVVFYAEEMGFFKKQGLNVEIQSMASGPVTTQAVIGNAIDIGVANVATVSTAYERGIRIKYIAPAAIATPQTKTDVIMVPKDSTVKGGADFNGKVVGINGLRDLQQLEAMGWVDKHGGNAKNVQFVEVPFPDMGAALQSHRVAADLPVEPFVTASKDQGKVIGDALEGVAPRFMILGWIVNESYANAHPEIVTKFANAIRDAAVWSNAHEKESAAILVRHSKLSPAIAQSMARAEYGTRLDPAMIQPVIDAAHKYGFLPNPLSANELIWRAPGAR